MNDDGVADEVTTDLSELELLALVRTAPSKFFEVTESHAEHVLRRQSAYQEVTGDALAEWRNSQLRRDPVEAAEESTPAKVTVKKRGATRRGGSK